MKLVMRLSPSVTSGGLPGRRSVLHKAQLAVKYAPVRSLLLGARQQRSAINCLGRRWHCTPSPGRAALPPPASAPTRGSRPSPWDDVPAVSYVGISVLYETVYGFYHFFSCFVFSLSPFIIGRFKVSFVCGLGLVYSFGESWQGAFCLPATIFDENMAGQNGQKIISLYFFGWLAIYAIYFCILFYFLFFLKVILHA